MNTRVVLILRFLFLTLGLGGAYTYLNHHFIHNLQIIHIKESLSDVVVPIVLSLLFTFLILGPAIYQAYTRSREGLFFLAVILFVAPLISAQYFVKDHYAKLLTLETPTELFDHNRVRFYEIKNYTLQKTKAYKNVYTNVTGRYGDDFEINIYFSIPLLDDPNVISSVNRKMYIGKKYRNVIEDFENYSDKEINTIYDEFVIETEKKYKRMPTHGYRLFTRIGHSDDRENFLKAIQNQQTEASMENIVILRTESYSYEQRGQLAQTWLVSSSAIACIVWLLLVLLKKPDVSRLPLFPRLKLFNKDIKDLWFFIFPNREFFITPILIDSMIILLVVMVYSGVNIVHPDVDDLLKWGGCYKPNVNAGEYWRLISSNFIHGGIQHLLVNLFALIIVALFLEPFLGKIVFLLMYVLCGMVGSIAHLTFNGAVVSVGSSGAIFGLFGLFAIMCFSKNIDKQIKLIHGSLIIGLIIATFVMGLFIRMDHAGHLGGLACGFVCGLLIYPFYKNKKHSES